MGDAAWRRRHRQGAQRIQVCTGLTQHIHTTEWASWLPFRGSVIACVQKPRPHLPDPYGTLRPLQLSSISSRSGQITQRDSAATCHRSLCLRPPRSLLLCSVTGVALGGGALAMIAVLIFNKIGGIGAKYQRCAISPSSSPPLVVIEWNRHSGRICCCVLVRDSAPRCSLYNQLCAVSPSPAVFSRCVPLKEPCDCSCPAVELGGSVCVFSPRPGAASTWRRRSMVRSAGGLCQGLSLN